jgi:diadenylate cyclase
MRLGEAGFMHTTKPEVEEVIDHLVNSAAYLSKNKIGAIVAIERRDRLGGILETGVPVQAIITSELLNTLFWPGSVLHDMGVVIRDGEILAARCQFPLSDEVPDDGTLGSRHRAGITLSRDSDAVVLVVSAETGSIGLAIDGNLRRGLTVTGLRRELHQLLTGNIPKEE